MLFRRKRLKDIENIIDNLTINDFCFSIEIQNGLISPNQLIKSATKIRKLDGSDICKIKIIDLNFMLDATVVNLLKTVFEITEVEFENFKNGYMRYDKIEISITYLKAVCTNIEKINDYSKNIYTLDPWLKQSRHFPDLRSEFAFAELNIPFISSQIEFTQKNEVSLLEHIKNYLKYGPCSKTI